MKIASTSPVPGRNAFSLMELLVVVAIIVVLASISYPIVMNMRNNAHKAEALARMKALAAAVGNFVTQNNGDLPAEDASGKDDWETAMKPEAEKAWYNALPRLMGKKGVGDFAKDGRLGDFYQKDSALVLPGAEYPESSRNTKPLFAIAFNTKLHRHEKGAKGEPKGAKPEIKLANVVNQPRTVILLEQGLPKEPKAHPTISRNDYDGSCKGSAKSFVARYHGKGYLAFLDGHCDLVSGSEILTSTGSITWEPPASGASPSAIIWTADPKDNPN